MATTNTHQRKPGKRGRVTGWSPGAARRNIAFLRSVDDDKLDGVGLAITLTIRDCPEGSAEWSKAIDTWIKRQRRAGLIRLHWVMEFQRRGVPHLHCAVWYDREKIREIEGNRAIHGLQAVSNPHMAKAHKRGEEHVIKAGMGAVADWIEITEKWGTGSKGQQVRPIDGPVGWFQYMAKHCGRGRQHYQRQQEALPAVWTSSPRVWGKSGVWTLSEPADATVGNRQWYRLRRLVRAQRVARARHGIPSGWADTGLLTRDHVRSSPMHGGKPLRYRLRNLLHAKGMLKCGERKLSEVRGISEWITQDQQADLLRALGH